MNGPLGGEARGRLLPVLAAMMAAAVAWWASRPYAVGVFHDDGVYAILAKSIATGQGYRFLHLPGAPVATHYPPGYPLLLALLWRVMPTFPANVSLFLFVNALLLGAATYGVARFAEDVIEWPRLAAIGVALVATLSTPLLMLSGLVLSEPLFVAALFPVLIGAERLVRSGTDSWRRTVLVAIGLGALALVRTHGLALAAGLLLVLAVRRRWRAVLLSAVVVAAVLAPWELWLAEHSRAMPDVLRGSYGPYADWLAAGWHGGAVDFVRQTMLINVREVGALLADHLSLADGPAARLLATLLAASAIVAGAVRLRRRAPVFIAFAVVYTLVLLAWPFTPWRFLFAAWPVVVLCIAASIEGVWGASRAVWVGTGRSAHGTWRASGTALVAAGALVLTAGAARAEGRAYRFRSWARPGAAATAAIAPLVRWVNAETQPGDVVAVDGEQVVYLFTSRIAVPIAPFTAAEYVRPRSAEDNATALRRTLGEFPVRYVLTISPALRAPADRLVAAGGAGQGMGAGPALVRVAPLGAGAAYRVERP